MKRKQTNWEILTLDAPAANNLAPVVTVEGKNFDWEIYGCKSNLPPETRVMFSVPLLNNKECQSDAIPLYALRQPEIPPDVKRFFKTWHRWYANLLIPAEHSLQVEFSFPLTQVDFPAKPFLALYYEFIDF
jgi:hypothetical protein